MVVAERYRLVEPLGSGGMGAVWRAEHLSLRSPVAVKMLNPAIADDPEMLERFLREAQAAAALRGNYVVQVFDYGVHDGMPFIAMELLSGFTLGTRLVASRRLSYADLAWTFAHVSRAVTKAHELGIVHRDLKPDNIFIVRDGDEERAKVLDFGIAKVLPSSNPLEEDNSKTTRTGTVLGTPFYMSPEQARGNRTVDYRADLWSMGVIAFECLTGRLPFTSSALGDLVVKICTQPAPLPSSLAEVPPGFDDWFERACQKAPEDRFQSMREQNESLQAVLGQSQPPLSPPNRSTPRARRVTPEASPISSDLRDHFADFQTLESIAPPANDAAKTEASTEHASPSDHQSRTPRVTSAAPVEVVAPRVPPSPNRRWLTAGVVATLAFGGLFLLHRENTRRSAAVNPEQLQATAASIIVEATTTPPTASPESAKLTPRELAAAETARAPAPSSATADVSTTPRLPTPVQETAPMDLAPSPVKLQKKAPGAHPAGQNPDQPSATASSPTVVSQAAETIAPHEPKPSSAAQERPAGDSKIGGGLFDDRE